MRSLFLLSCVEHCIIIIIMEARVSNVNSSEMQRKMAGAIRVRCSVHVFIKGSGYTLAIMARTRREYLEEMPRILAELKMVN